MVFHLEYYSVEELVEVLMRSASILGVELKPEGAEIIARRGRGTPRIVNRLLRRVRFAQVSAEGIISEVARDALDRMDVDHAGLDMDRRYLVALCEKSGGGPVGVETLSAALSEERSTLEDVHEPYLLQEGFIQRTPRGRIALALAYQHLGLDAPPSPQGKRSQPQGLPFRRVTLMVEAGHTHKTFRNHSLIQ